ncbi:CBS domain-containing protein [Buchananella felis]|uniref:magnesium transporter MgtE N-terminal domain-containing protein n=1 Tax=Buchananella felis TaxID=3231492 RepID=UPI003527FF07
MASKVSGRVFIARLIGTTVFDPIGDPVGRVHDLVLLQRATTLRAVGMVIEVTGKRRVFLPFTRITAIQPGAVVTTGLLNMRRFSQRSIEVLAMGQLMDRTVTLKDGSGTAEIQDLAIEKVRGRDWEVTTLYVQRTSTSTLGFRRGETLTVPVTAVTGLTTQSAHPQSAAALLSQFEGMKAADLADELRELPEARRLEVATQLSDERLADVLEELGDEEGVAILTHLKASRAADVLDVMQPDDAADLVGELPDQMAEELLELMEPAEAEDVRRLLGYGEHTAGGLMTTEPVILPPESTVAHMLALVRRQDIPPALAAMVMVVRPPLETPTGRFLGVVHLQRALREAPHLALGSILDTDIDAVAPDVAIGTVTRLMATYNLTALPVVDGDQRLLGAVSVDDVLDHLLPDDWREADEEQTDEAMTRQAENG